LKHHWVAVTPWNGLGATLILTTALSEVEGVISQPLDSKTLPWLVIPALASH